MRGKKKVSLWTRFLVAIDWLCPKCYSRLFWNDGWGINECKNKKCLWDSRKK